MIDFDGVLREVNEPYRDMMFHNADNAIKEMRRKGYQVYIFSTRAAHGNEQFIHDWLEENNIEVDGVTGLKLDANYYIDDKAIRFSGDWAETMRHIA